MALTRKFLAALGIEADKIDEIVTANAESLEGIKAERDSYKADAEKYKNAQKDLDNLSKYKADSEKLAEVQKELDDLKTATKDKDYDALKKEFDDYKADVEAKATKAAKETALRGILKDLNISEKGVKLALKYHNIDSIELDAEGKIKNATELRKSLKEDWGDYVVKEEEQGADTHNPPDGKGKSYKSKEEIMNIKDRSARQKAIAENPELFGISEGD